MIDIIKHEEATHGRSPTFNILSKDNDTDLKKGIISFDFSHPSKELLDKLQRALRQILFSHRKEELLSKKESSGTYIHFADMIRCAVEGRTCSSNYNQLAQSQAVRRLAREASKTIHRLKIWCVKEGEFDKTAYEKMIDETIKRFFYRDLFPSDNQKTLREESVIVNALDAVTLDSRWGTHGDLVDLACKFNINLHTLRNGRPTYAFQEDAERPVIIMNNKLKLHWTTHLSFLSSAFKGKSYHHFANDSLLTKSEILAVMRSYTTGFMATFSSRNHREEAQQIIALCSSQTSDIEAIIQRMQTYAASKEFEPCSSFKKSSIIWLPATITTTYHLSSPR